MPLRDFALLLLICLAWASNNIVAKYVLSVLHVPPFLFTALRFMIVTAVLAPWLRKVPKPFWRMIVVGLIMGAGNFGLIFVGLQTATPSAAAVVMQLSVPTTTLLSWWLLGERLQMRRALGIVLTVTGALVVIWDPAGLAMSIGLIYIALATVLGSLGPILMKQMEGVSPFQYQAWVGAISLLPMLALTGLFDHGHADIVLNAGWTFWAAILFQAVVVSILAHSGFFWIVQRHDANLIAPLTLMTPLATIGLGVLIFDDPFGLQMIIGTTLVLVGVLVIVLRPNVIAALLARQRVDRQG